MTTTELFRPAQCLVSYSYVSNTVTQSLTVGLWATVGNGLAHTFVSSLFLGFVSPDCESSIKTGRGLWANRGQGVGTHGQNEGVGCVPPPTPIGVVAKPTSECEQHAVKIKDRGQAHTRPATPVKDHTQ